MITFQPGVISPASRSDISLPVHSLYLWILPEIHNTDYVFLILVSYKCM